VVQC